MADTEKEVEVPYDPDAPFKLSAPLTTHKGELTELPLEMPTARSFVKFGAPYKVNGDGGVDLNIKAMMGFASDMTGIDAILLESLKGCDVMPLCWAIVRKLRYSPLNG